MCSRARPHGFSLIELVFFIIVVGVAFAGTVLMYTQATRGSVDPVVRKQALAIAASLLEEIQLRGFTYCDADDANVYTATSASVGPGACAAIAETCCGPDAGETSRTTYDHVNDYHGFQMLSGIQDITGTLVPGLNAYSVTSVTVANAGATFSLPADEVLLIGVTVAAPAGIGVTLHGYRFRYAPNSP